MEIKIYITLLAYFLLGGIIMFFVTRNKNDEFKKKNWLKYFVYLIIINVLFISIFINPTYFAFLCVFIIILGLYEILSLSFKTRKIISGGIFFIIFLSLGILFYKFTFLSANYLFYTLFLTIVFDSFSQLTGQLLGRKKLFIKLSPNKTYAGLIGGIVSTILTAILIRRLINVDSIESIVLGFGFSISALIGDLAASFAKRKFEVKDFGNFIPGHGGILDRFDSLFATAAFMFVIVASDMF